MSRIFYFLDNPRFYNLVQKIFASNGTKAIASVLTGLDNGHYNTTVLDVGCGTGKHVSIFRNCSYTGVDVNQNYLSYASSKYPFGRFIRADASRLPFPDKSFDQVFSACVFHHLSNGQINKTLDEMKRVCKNGGVVCVIDNIFPPKTNVMGYILFKLDIGKFQRSFKEMETLLTGADFRVVEKLKDTFPSSYCVSKFFKQ